MKGETSMSDNQITNRKVLKKRNKLYMSVSDSQQTTCTVVCERIELYGSSMSIQVRKVN